MNSHLKLNSSNNFVCLIELLIVSSAEIKVLRILKATRENYLYQLLNFEQAAPHNFCLIVIEIRQPQEFGRKVEEVNFVYSTTNIFYGKKHNS